MTEPGRCWSVTEAAEWLGVSGLYRHIQDGEVPALRLGNRIVLDPDELRDALRVRPGESDEHWERPRKPRPVTGHFARSARAGR